MLKAAPTATVLMDVHSNAKDGRVEQERKVHKSASKVLSGFIPIVLAVLAINLVATFPIFRGTFVYYVRTHAQENKKRRGL